VCVCGLLMFYVCPVLFWLFYFCDAFACLMLGFMLMVYDILNRFT